MSTKKNLAERAALVGSRRQKAHAEETREATPATAPKVRVDPVRLSTDISPNTYRFLIDYCAGIAAELGKPRVTHTSVLRRLLDELQQDPALQARVRDQLIAQSSK